MSIFPRVTENKIKATREAELARGQTVFRVFEVLALDEVSAVSHVLSDKGVGIGVALPGSSGEYAMVCNSFRVRTITAPSGGGTGFFEVAFGFESKNDATSPPGSEDDPNGDNTNTPPLTGPPGTTSVVKPQPGGPPVFYWTTGLESQRRYENDAGEVIVNTKGETPRDGLSVVVPTLSLSVHQIRVGANPNVSQLYNYTGKCNSDSWNGFAPGQVMCQGFTSSPTAANQRIEVANFRMGPDISEAGDYFDVRIRNEDAEGNLLDINGNLYGTDPTTVPAKTPKFVPSWHRYIDTGSCLVLVFRVFKRVPFSGLGF